MLKLTISKKAEKDIRDIWLYSFNVFGKEQANLYINELKRHFLNLQENPYIGVSVDYIRQGYFQHTIQSHNVFYKVSKDNIFIVRVLHNKMSKNLNL